MDLSRITKFDDNSLFRFLSKSYSKSRSKSKLNLLTRTTDTSFAPGLTHYNQKLRSQSTAFCNTFSKSISSGESYSAPRPGFLKYRKFSTTDAVPLNSSIQTAKKSLHDFQISLKSMDDKGFTDLKKSISLFENGKNSSSEEFGLRSLVKRVKNQFRFPQESRLKKKEINVESIDYDILCDDSKKMFLGEKTYNLNNFLVTNNGKGLFKKTRDDIKTSIMRRKLRKGFEKEVNATLI